MQERCDMKEIQKMLGSFSCPELAELSALATKYKMNFADLGIKRDLIDPKLKDNLEEISKVMRLWRENIDFQSLEKTIETFKTNNFFESPEYSALIKKMEENRMNRVILMGRLTRNPEIKYGGKDNDMAVARYTLAVNRRYKKDGEQEADFISCVVFGKGAEFAQKYLRKGMKVAVLGRISTGSYKDKDGKTVYYSLDDEHVEEILAMAAHHLKEK